MYVWKQWGKPKFPCEKIFMGEKFTYGSKKFPFFLCVYLFLLLHFFFTLGDGDDKIQIYSIVWYITSIKFSMLCQICFICYSIYMYVSYVSLLPDNSKIMVYVLCKKCALSLLNMASFHSILFVTMRMIFIFFFILFHS